MQHSNKTIVILAETSGAGRPGQEHDQLIRACRRGDQKAQFELYRRYHRAMYNTTLRIVRDPADAEDVMQEAFLKAYTKLNTYRGEVSFGAWLKRIVINKALDFLRLKKERLSLDETGEPMEITEKADEPEDLEYRVEIIKKAIHELPQGYRIVLTLILIEGYDHEEVSEILGISNATSRTQFHRAKKKLIDLLKQKDVRDE